MSIFKYYGDPGGHATEHRGALQWVPGEFTVPIRNLPRSIMTREELETGVVEAMDFHRGRFRLWIPEELKAYEDIRDKAANGWYQIVDLTRTVVTLSETGEPDQIVFLEWLQVYGEVINGKRPVLPHQKPEIGLEHASSQLFG